MNAPKIKSLILYVTVYWKIVEEKYGNRISIYTDDSKGESGIGAAVCEQIIKATYLPVESCIFSAEMHGIGMALDIVSESWE